MLKNKTVRYTSYEMTLISSFTTFLISVILDTIYVHEARLYNNFFIEDGCRASKYFI